MKYNIENVFVTEGFPELTYVKPSNYNNILVDIKKEGKPVVIEGQSGTGKTTTVHNIIGELSPVMNFNYLTARKKDDIVKILDLIRNPNNGNYIIDDFHRLPKDWKKTLSDYAKVAADEGSVGIHPKLVLIGINKIGTELLTLSSDIAKRFGIHRIEPGDLEIIGKLIKKGEESLNIKFYRPKVIYNESKGDYWLTQVLCQMACLQNGIIDTQEELKYVSVSVRDLRKEMIKKLHIIFSETVKCFSRGIRYRPTNDPYFTLLKVVSNEKNLPVDLKVLANRNNNHIRISINRILGRLNSHLLHNDLLNRSFYYNPETTLFNIEDPALFYYIKHLNWDKLKKDCGFKITQSEFKYDIAISFAGENRKLAEYITKELRKKDYEVFYDKLYESNYLGESWTENFEQIFRTESRYILCILDIHHRSKIWPTFERDVFKERVKEGAVLPVFLDDTVFPGIPSDIVGMTYKYADSDKIYPEKINKIIIDKLLSKID